MKVLLKDLPKSFCGIYKITFPNGKVYIGQSIDIKRRMQEHNTPSADKTPCDLAINKYGKIQEIEILELCSKDELNSKEIYWIKYYRSNEKERGYNLTIGEDSNYLIGENNQKAVFSNAQVLDIRKRRYLGERKKDVYKDYSQYSFSTFEKVWLGKGYSNVGVEFLIQANSKTKQEYSSNANKGVKNGRSKVTKEQILDIRRQFDNQVPISQIAKQYNFISKSTVYRIAHRESYKDI